MNYVISNMLCMKKNKRRGIIASMCTKLFKTDLARLVFNEVDNEIYFAEDAEFVYRCFLMCSSISVTDVCGYYYYTRENSCSNTIHMNFLENISHFYVSMYNCFKEHECAESLLWQLQQFIKFHLIIAPSKLGFDTDFEYLKYISPFINTLKGKRIVLYGAGKVGQDYYLQMMKTKDEMPVMWVDKNADEYPVLPVNSINDTEFDYIIIAVAKKEILDEIKGELIAMGVQEEKILWDSPIYLYR